MSLSDTLSSEAETEAHPIRLMEKSELTRNVYLSLLCIEVLSFSIKKVTFTY